ncbi:hypothetical protein GCM10027290_67810 [Micromonospora sonneratiae]|uniref:FxSxx-COOH system tetratricopeptide repeat protein n=1 Tax=Micromonospora sonneratiae TaxID=1184706 RepID=A0ABW3YG87_9ACTN
MSNLAARNAGFVGRAAALAAARQLLQSRGRVVVRSGNRMGGVGKTQLAIEYGHRHADDYDLTWLVPAEQHDLIGGHLAQLAITQGLVGADVSTQAAVAALHAAIRTQPRWLLIFDNAEDPRALSPWLPPRGGHIIITSRSPGWDEIAELVEVNLFDRAESVELLQRRMPGLPGADAVRLAQELGDLPLAVAQAASVMAEHGISAAEYIDLLVDNTWDILDNGTPTSYPASLAATIGVSLDRLTEENPAAAQLLQLCSMLAPEPIPLAWFTVGAAALPQPLAAAAAQQYTFSTTLVRVIGAHGLLSISAGGMQVHRLVSAIVRSRLDPQERAALRQQADDLLTAIAPEDADAPATWALWSLLAPHITAAEPATTGNEKIRDIACRFVLYLLRRGENGPALRLVEHLYHKWRDDIGSDDRHTLKAAAEYGHAIYYQGHLHEANRIINDTYERRQRVFGADHPDTFRSAGDLVLSLFSVGDYQRAREIGSEVLPRCRRILGADHADTLRVAGGLASNLFATEDYEQARELSEDSFARYRRVFGEDHPATLGAAGTLATILQLVGETERALAMGEDLVARSRRVLGERHPDTLRVTVGFAMLLGLLDQYERSHAIYNDFLPLCREVLGVEHPDMLLARVGFARALLAMNRAFDARRIVEDTLPRQRRVLGADHPQIPPTVELLDQIRIALGGRPGGGKSAPKKKRRK